MASDVSLSALCAVRRVPGDVPSNFFHDLPRCGGLYRSAIAAVTPDGDSN